MGWYVIPPLLMSHAPPGIFILNIADFNSLTDHGLVYADYYFLLVGNKLLDMGIGGHIISQSE
jgi:hypothetical protein